jgi:cytochrome c553
MVSATRLVVLWTACALLISLPAVAAAADPAAPAAPEGAAAAASEETKALWAKNCASCHGADAKAKTKMGEMLKIRDLTDPAVHATLTRDNVSKAIKEGVKKEGSDKPAMRGFADKLTDAQVSALTDYVLAAGK